MIAPLLVAFGLVRDVPWHFYPLTVLLIGLFIILPGVFGAALAIGIGRHLDRKSFQIVLLVVALVLLAFVAFWWKTNPVDDDLLDKRTLEALDQLLAKTRFTMFPFLPSYWLSSAVLQWAEGIIEQRDFFRGGAVEQHAVFRQHRLHAVWQSFLRHGLGGAKPRGRRVQIEFFRATEINSRDAGLAGKVVCQNSPGSSPTPARWP